MIIIIIIKPIIIAMKVIKILIICCMKGYILQTKIIEGIIIICMAKIIETMGREVLPP
jgi:hypothetical protein